MSDKTRKQFLIAGLVGVGALLIIARYRKSIFKRLKSIIGIYEIPEREIVITESPEKCVDLIKRMKVHCEKYNVLGFDAEWVSVNGSRRPVAIIQLCTSEGLCGLIRLNKIGRIPQELRDILEDNTILKVGVAPLNDANLLFNDYSIRVSSTFDLRFLALKTGMKPGSLGNLTKEVINIDLDKDWKIRCSDWEANKLSDAQVDYAAKDAQCGIEVFKVLYSQTKRSSTMKDILEFCDAYADTHFKNKMTQNGFDNKKSIAKINRMIIRKYSTRSKPLYDNCYLEAPDGETLCTIEKKKALWYIARDLGKKIQDDPFIVRLNFEPQGRASGDVGKYYLKPKENHCVVCAKTENLIRKNVVPREYRKNFPPVMKDHSSHDVLLLCAHCHQQSNMIENKMRFHLEELCNAPLKNSQPKEMRLLANQERESQKAACALLFNSEKMPEKRQEELKDKLRSFYPDRELTKEFIREIFDAPKKPKENDDEFQKHGEIVVEWFKNNDGLVKLEKMWREFFLETMKPKYMPELWSVDHNSERLEIRATEGRVKVQDLKAAGLDISILKQSDVVKNGKAEKQDTNTSPQKTESLSDPKSEDPDASSSETEFKSFSEPNVSKNQSLDGTMREEYLSDATLASHYETIRSDTSALDYSDFKSFEASNSEKHKYDSDDTDSTLSQPSSETDHEDSSEKDKDNQNNFTKN